MSKRPDVVLRNKSKKQRDAISLSWKADTSKRRQKIAKALTGNTNGHFRKITPELRKKLSLARKGKAMGLIPWNKGTGLPEKLRDATRHSKEYKEWRTAVFKRDNYQCVIGGKAHGNKLQADHIKPFSKFPELRFIVSNGRTLCKPCHYKTPTYGHKAKSYEPL